MTEYQVQKWVYATFKRASSPEEIAVLRVLFNSFFNPVSQTEIAKSEPWLGCVEKYEKKSGMATSLRKVRSIIRKLRILRIPVLSSAKGYYLPKSVDAVTEFRARIFGELRARTVSTVEMWVALNATFTEIGQFPTSEEVEFFTDLDRFLRDHGCYQEENSNDI